MSAYFTEICVYLIGREAKRRAIKERIEREITDSSEEISGEEEDQESINDDSDDDTDIEMQCVRGIIKVMESVLCG